MVNGGRLFREPGFFWAGILLSIEVLLTVIFWWRLPPEIPLFFSRPVGRAQLASSWLLVLLPAFSGLFLFGNLILARLLPRDSLTMTKIVAWMSTLTVLLILLAMVHILLLTF